MEEFIELIKCPQSKMIFNSPVLSNGITYEEQLCDDPDRIPYKGLISLISAFLDEFPEYKDQQYKPVSMKLNGTTGKASLMGIINSGNYEKIYSYEKFTLGNMTHDIITKFITNAQDAHIYHFIDNMINVDDEGGEIKWKIINYICKCRPNNINTLKYIIEKGGSMKSFCPDDNWYPLHQLIGSSKDEECMILGINEHIKEGLTFYETNSSGGTIFLMVIRNSPPNIIKHMFNYIDKTNNMFLDNIEICLNNIYETARFSDEDKESLVGCIFS